MDKIEVSKRARLNAQALLKKIDCMGGASDEAEVFMAFARFERDILSYTPQGVEPVAWMPIESAPKDGTKAVLYFPQHVSTDFDGVDYSLRLAVYRENATFPHGTWCDQGTNHDSFEGPDMSGNDCATLYLPLPAPAANAHPPATHVAALVGALRWALLELRGKNRYNHPQQALDCFDQADAALAPFKGQDDELA